MANGAIRAPSKKRVNHSSEGGDAQDKSDSNGVVTHFGDPYFKGGQGGRRPPSQRLGVAFLVLLL